MKTKSTSQSAPARRSPWLAVVFTRRRLGEGGFFSLCVLLASVFCLAGVFIALGGIASSRTIGQGGSPNQSVAAQKIAPWVTEHTANGQQAEFFVVLADQADLSPAAALNTKAEKGRYVYNTLLNKSQTTQGPILQWLRERGVEYESFYIVNGILVTGRRVVA